MGRVWLIVLASMCITLAASWFWHASEMQKQARRYQTEDDAVTANTARISAYRDVLKEKGVVGGEEYLSALASEQHDTAGK